MGAKAIHDESSTLPVGLPARIELETALPMAARIAPRGYRMFRDKEDDREKVAPQP
jgi:hypothetical protein